MSAKKSTADVTKEAQKQKELENPAPSEKIILEVRRLADRTIAKMMRNWYNAQLDGQENPKMFAAIKKLSLAKKSFLSGSAGKKSLFTYLDKVNAKLGRIREAVPHLVAIREIIEAREGMPLEDFSELIDLTRGHWLQDGPDAD